MNITSVQSLNNFSVRIGAVVDAPFSFECFNEYPNYCRKPGVEIEYIYSLIHDLLQLNVVWIKYTSNELMEDALDKKDIDMIGNTYLLQQSRIERWAYTSTAFYDMPAFIVKKHYKINNNEGFLLETFTWDLWGLIIAFSLATILLKAFPTRNNNGKHFFHFNCIFSFRKLFLVIWFIVLGIILNLFVNLIVVNLTLPNVGETNLFTDFDQLGELLLHKKCKFATVEPYRNDAFIKGYIMDPIHNRSWANVFTKAYQSNPPIYRKTRAELAHLINQPDSCFVGLDWRSTKDYYLMKFCNIKMVEIFNEFLPGKYAYYHQLDHFSEILDAILLTSPLADYREYLNRKYYFSIPTELCDTDTTLNGETNEINLIKLKNVFILLFIGIFISGVVFLVFNKYF